MPVTVNLDKDRASLGDYKGIRLAIEESKKRVTLYFAEDAREIVRLLSEADPNVDEQFLDESYWADPDDKCNLKFRPVLVAREDRKRGKGRKYSPKYNLKRSMKCEGECSKGKKCKPRPNRLNGSVICRCE